MGTDIKTAIRPAIILLLLFTVITGLVYPLAITGIAQAVFPHQANGSLIRDGNRIVGSELIGQNFASPAYFHPRPSAAGDGYNAAGSSGSNLGPTSKALADNISQRVGDARKDGVTGPVPADMVTASGSGLDPDISPANALDQARRVAAARGIPLQTVNDLVTRSTKEATLGILGEAHVNVVELNRQLDRVSAELAR